MNYGFIIDNRKCIGCHACTVACKSEHSVPLGVNRTWVKYVEKGLFPDTRRTFTVHRCNHCADAPCVEICPVTALFLRADGIVDFDSARCIGCKSCMQACPYDALYIDPAARTAAKCNYCAHRVERGIEPACVVVCPEHAIVSGDMDDPSTEIAQMLARQRVSVRRAEKGTRPKLFYIDGDEAALRPLAAPPQAAYYTTEQVAGVGHHADRGDAASMLPSSQRVLAHADAGANARAMRDVRRTYDAPSKGVLWGWEVAGYLWTKSLSTGLLLVLLLLNLTGLRALDLETDWGLAWISLALLFITGVLLVKDLDRPDRFLYVLLRPQWRSWLVRGAYLISSLGALGSYFALELTLFAEAVPEWLQVLLALLAVLTAIYTGFLFAQAKGRDAWQNPLLPVHMAVQSLAHGAALLLAWTIATADWLPDWAPGALAVLLALAVALILGEVATPGASAESAAAHRLLVHGPLRGQFWFGLVAGYLLPVLLLLAPGGASLQLTACLLAIGATPWLEHARIRAPQLLPLS